MYTPWWQRLSKPTLEERFELRKFKSGGGRVGFKNGNGVYDEKELLGKRVRELMDEGYEFGEAVKQAMKEGYADGGRIRKKFNSGGMEIQTLNPLFPTKDPTSDDFKPLDVPGAIIPPLAIGAGAKRLKDIFFSKNKDESKKEIVERIEKVEKDKKEPEPPKGPNFDKIAEKFLIDQAKERLSRKEMDKSKRDNRTMLARDLDLPVNKSGLYELRKDDKFYNKRLETLKDKKVNFDGYYSTREIANLLGIKTNSGVIDFINSKKVPSVKDGLFTMVKLNDFLTAYEPTRKRILEAPPQDKMTLARTNFLSELGGSFYQRFKDMRRPKWMPPEVKEIYEKYNLSEIEGGHAFPIEFFTKKFAKDGKLSDERQFDWIYRNKDKLIDKNNIVFQSKELNAQGGPFYEAIGDLKEQYKILTPLVNKYEGKGPVTNLKDKKIIEEANNKIMNIIAKTQFDAQEYIEKSTSPISLPNMKEGGIHGALFNTDTGTVSLYTGAGESAGTGTSAVEKGGTYEKLNLASKYLDIVSSIIEDEGDRQILIEYINDKILPRYSKGGLSGVDQYILNRYK